MFLISTTTVQRWVALGDNKRGSLARLRLEEKSIKYSEVYKSRFTAWGIRAKPKRILLPTIIGTRP